MPTPIFKSLSTYYNDEYFPRLGLVDKQTILINFKPYLQLLHDKSAQKLQRNTTLYTYTQHEL